MSTKLHVGNISSAVAEIDLQQTFAQFGAVEAVEIARDPTTGRSKGFAIVAMTRDEDAATAIGRLNFTHYEGRIIGVSRSRDSRL
ncbi:MAG: RNA-binding protein [Pseudomonadota bacterium]